MKRHVAAVIVTYNRPVELLQCVAAVAPQVDTLVVVNNGGPIAEAAIGKLCYDSATRVSRIVDGEQPPNLSRLWNRGLVRAAMHADASDCAWHDVAVLNDDVILPPGWVEAMGSGMRARGAAAASTGPVHTAVHHTLPGTTALSERMEGFAFVLAGEKGARADERLRWWCGDNDLDMQSRTLGGTVIIPGWPVQHLHPDESTTGVLAAQTAVDMAMFIEKWGFRPW